MGGRVYDPLGGRFTTPDPFMQAPFSSQGQNPYAYVFNDPINNTDPSGFITTGSTGGDIVTAAVFGTAWGAVGYGIATEAGADLSFSAVIPTSAAGNGFSSAIPGVFNVLTTITGPIGAARSGYERAGAAPSQTPSDTANKLSSTQAAAQNHKLPGPPTRVPKPLADRSRYASVEYEIGRKLQGPEK